MDRKYLKQNQYSWDQDPRKLRVNDLIPDTRCCHCGRIFLNAKYGIFFCRLCDEAMSVCKDGPKHDYDSFLNAKKALAERDLRVPIDFDEEKFYFNKNGKQEEPHFITAAGKIIPTEADADSDLYRMGLEK